jgi:fructokinase
MNSDKENKPKLITIGSCTLDTIIEVKDILRFELLEEDFVKKYTAIEYSKKLNLKDVRFFQGGSAANIASNCSMLGLPSMYLGVLGDDFSAQMCIDDLKDRGVDTSQIILTDKDKTAFSVILKSGWGKDRSILAYKGANNLIKPSDVEEKFFEEIIAFAWTSLTKDNSCSAIEKAIDLTHQRDGCVFAAPSMSIIANAPEWAKKLISKSDILSLNKDEAKELTGKDSDVGIIKKLTSLGPRLVAITNGSKGSLISDGENVLTCGIYEGKVEDTTGAGDAFMSGIILSDYYDYPLEKTAKVATAVGAFESRKTGVRYGIPNDIKVIEDFIEENSLEHHHSKLEDLD